MDKRLIEVIVAAILGTIVIFLIRFIINLPPFPVRIETFNEKDAVVEVEYYQIQQSNVAQIDPEWRVRTEHGYHYTSSKMIRVGDSIDIKIIRYTK